MSSILKGIVKEISKVDDETLDEISGEVLGRYIPKSRDQRIQAQKKVIDKTATPDDWKTLGKRGQGTSTAMNKLLGTAKVPANESANTLYSARQAAIFKDLGDGYYLGDDSYDDDDGFTKEGYTVYHKEGEDQYRTVSSVSMSPYSNPEGYIEDEIERIIQKDKSELKENKRIIGHDAKDPEIAVKGGAGSYNLSTLKRKARGEAEALLNDVTAGKFKAAAYNINQLKNTLETIAEAEAEMEKSYFGEDKDPCWKNYKQIGMKKKNGKQVPNCVPKKSVKENTESEVEMEKSYFSKSKKSPHWNNLGFDVRTDILWSEKIFENTETGETFNTWFKKYRNNMPVLNKGQSVILAMVAYMGDQIKVIYGRAKYEGENDTYYILKNKTGIHTYNKRNQIVFSDKQQFNKFLMNLKLKFEVEVETVEQEVMETKDPCWKNYKQIGMKEKNGKQVPNCVPKKSVKEVADTRTTVNQTGGFITPEHDRAYAILKKKAPRLYNFIKNDAPVPLDPIMTLQALQHMGNENEVMSMIKRELAKDTERMYDKNHPALAENIKRLMRNVLSEAKKKAATVRKKTKESLVIKGTKR